jgi:radial spoke head protein 9
MGVTYSDKYEFPTKCFYWASSDDFSFKAFPAHNTQHKDKVDAMLTPFTGNHNFVHIRVEPEISPEEAEAAANAEPEPEAPLDPLASTEEEDPNANFVPLNFTELDRLHFTVQAIENDCHIMPKGAVKLTENHEVRRNTAFRGLSCEEALTIEGYQHFRNVQDMSKLSSLLDDGACFNRDFLDEASAAKTKGAWAVLRGGSKGDVAVVRNLEWTGYSLFHQMGTSKHG